MNFRVVFFKTKVELLKSKVYSESPKTASKSDKPPKDNYEKVVMIQWSETWSDRSELELLSFFYQSNSCSVDPTWCSKYWEDLNFLNLLLFQSFSFRQKIKVYLEKTMLLLWCQTSRIKNLHNLLCWFLHCAFLLVLS